MRGLRSTCSRFALLADGVLVADSVILLGATMLSRRELPAISAFVLFVLVGLIHGYALGESIYDAERAPFALI